MIRIPATVPPLPRAPKYARNLPVTAALRWIGAGWSDFSTQPGPSIAYGCLITLISAAIIFGLFRLELDYILFPALAGFFVVGPVLAIGLYEKSRRIALGQKVTLAGMVFVKPASGGQMLFVGVLLSLLGILWLRAAVLIYALFFGLRGFPGLDHILPMLLTTGTGALMLIAGTLVGGLFAAFAFAISMFSIPMLLDKPVDALTAMGTSMSLVWNNLPVMLAFAALVLGLTLLALVSGLIGMIVIFPLLGHATWHAYRALERGP